MRRLIALRRAVRMAEGEIPAMVARYNLRCEAVRLARQFASDLLLVVVAAQAAWCWTFVP